MNTVVKLIVGLGNPGSAYEHSRHNAGADFVSEIANKYNVSLQTQNKFFGATARISIAEQDVRLLIPNTFMNLSGQAVGAIAGFYNILPEEILVAHDELDLNPGVSRLKKGGGHGGHNGLKDIIKALGNSRAFARLRIGIGHPGHASDVVDFVLRRAPQSEQALIQNSIDDALNALPLAVAGRWNDAMKILHSS